MATTEPNTCSVCEGTGLTEGELCETCYGRGAVPAVGVFVAILKRLIDLEDKCDDILDKCDDIFEAMA